jgi:spermidine synthase
MPITDTSDAVRQRTLLAGIALSSFSTLLLELALTRLFSVVLFYHFAFLSISIALLGLGAGGVFAYLFRRQIAQNETRRLAALLSFGNAMLVVAGLHIILHIPVSLELSWSNFGRLTIIYLAAAVPFFFTGLLFSVVFARETHLITRLYGADLAGGALACLALVPLLNWIGGPNAVLFSAFAMAVSGCVWAPSGAMRKAGMIGAAALAALIAVNNYTSMIDVIYAKGERRDKSTGVEYVRWNAISRVEVDGHSNGSKNIVIDADAGTAIMNVAPHAWQGTDWEKNLMSTAPSLPNVLRPRGDFAIIGPGGGVDVLRAVASGSPSVTGIEINPIIVNRIMRGRYADYAYHLYDQPEVHIHVSDGRSFVRNSLDRFDVLQMTLVDTWASTAAGAFALSENNLYTVEAFREYFEHLKPDGMIAITRWEFHQPREALRVVSVAMDALHKMGVSDPARHFMVVSEGELDADGIPVIVLAKRSPFTAGEEQSVQADLDSHPSLDALYLPSQPKSNPFSALIAGNDPYAFARSYAYNVAPVTDNAPFFFFTLKTGQVLNEESLQQGIDWKVNLGVVVLGMVLVISVVAVLAFLIIPMLLGGGPPGSAVSGPVSAWTGTARALSLLYFVAIGLGYILVEIAFIQRFVLFLGHPTYALTVVIFLLLLSSGAGSLASRRWLSSTSRCSYALMFIAAAVLLYVAALPPILATLVGLPFPAKLAISSLVLVPLGFAMGMPFPTGLRALAAWGHPPASASSGTTSAEAQELVAPSGASPDNCVEWAWAMNAASSVLGSVLAMLIAIHFGMGVALTCGAAAYLAALALLPSLRRVRI